MPLYHETEGKPIVRLQVKGSNKGSIVYVGQDGQCVQHAWRRTIIKFCYETLKIFDFVDLCVNQLNQSSRLNVENLTVVK